MSIQEAASGITESTQDEVTQAAANIVTHAAAAIHQLIQRSPQSPSEAEIAAVLEDALRESVADEGVSDLVSDRDADGPLTSVEFGPMLGRDGEKLDFGFTNKQFGDLYCPWIRTAFIAVGRDHHGVTEMVRGLAEGHTDARMVFQMLKAWEDIEDKFGGIAGIAKSAWARVIAVAEVLEQEDSDVGRALNEGAGKYIDDLRARKRASGCDAGKP